MKVEEKNTEVSKQNEDEKNQNDKDINIVKEKEDEKDQVKKSKEIEDTDSTNKNETNDIKIKNLEEKILRNLAEMENQRRRFEKEREDAFEFGGFTFAKETLALIDNLERAKTSFSSNAKLKENKDFPKILETFEILEKDLVAIFKRNHVEQITCLNEKFDPNFHQAMLEVDDSSKEPGIVVQEIQKGYIMKGRLLRPAMVGVTRFKAEEDQKVQKNKENYEDKK
tara:strand:+ start:618 stop:1292 length:675 start_codon:yes stop_codon:yes gene_type:complete